MNPNEAGGPTQLRPLIESYPLDSAVENNNAHSPSDQSSMKAKYVRRRKGKSARPLPNKKVKEKGNASDSCTSVEASSTVIFQKVSRPLDQANDSSPRRNAVNTSKVPECDRYTDPSIVLENTVGDNSSINAISGGGVKNQQKVISNQSEQLPEKPNFSRQTDKSQSRGNEPNVNLGSVVKELKNCYLHDADAIFNELSPDEKFMLQSNFIEVLKKKSDKYPLAVFHCTICKFYANTIPVCRLHIKNNSHAVELKERRLLETLRLIPPASPGHIRALDNMVLKNVTKLRMGEAELKICMDVYHEVSAFVAEKFPGCSLTLYGSVATFLALKESNVDMNLRVPSTVNGPTTLASLVDSLSLTSNFRNVEKDFDEGRPSIHFIHQETNVKCCICLSKEETLKTTEIIAKYQMIDPRFSQLAVIFRKWAKMCKIDDYKSGMWPPHTFPLLLIYYLQQCEPPVLPVLHELKGDPDDDSYLDPSELNGKWQSRNKMSVGELWLGLLRFYAVDYAHSERVVCIRRRAPVKRSVKNWIGKRTAIEDPFCVKRNVSRTIIHNFSFKYIMNCFRKSYLHYGIPRTCKGHLYANIQPMYPKLQKDEEYMKRNSAVSWNLLKMQQKSKLFSFEEQPSLSSVKESGGEKNEENDESMLSKLGSEKPPDSAYIIAEELSLADAILFSSHIRDDVIKYDLVADNGNKVPPTICSICTMDGHSKADCPDARLPPLPPLPPMTDEFLAHLNEFCSYIFDEYSQKPNDITRRKEILYQLEEYLSTYFPDVQLSLFGSSTNGFGFKNSDLDICLTFKGVSSGEGIDTADLIQKLVFWLRRMPTVRNIVPIPSAKVPIVKFRHIQTQLEGDISLYNTLAQHNTQLLKTYTLIDNRVKVLGYVMKTFAKLCDICDASRGSLSSYAYTLMVLYFLQQCDPPVIPVLQEISDIIPKPKDIQEGQDVWFFKDLERLKEVWPEYGKNKLCVGALWLQMLRFYTEEFDFEQYVISIKQKKVVHKFEKMWFKKPMAIEDPFDIEHNLGGALSRKMKLFIIKSLRKGRHHFGSPIPTLPPGIKSWKDYFLNPSNLKEGAPPNNGCHICKKIGHKVRNCPERNMFSKEKRDDGDHKKVKNNKVGFAHHPLEPRRRQPVAGGHNRGGQLWARGAPLMKKGKLMPPPEFPVQQMLPPRNVQSSLPHQEWYSQQWKHLQPHGATGAPANMPLGLMAGGPHPESSMPLAGPMPTCAAVERDMALGNLQFCHSNAFRSAEDWGQRYHEPCLPVTQYRKAGRCDDVVGYNLRGEGQNMLRGAIPKMGPVAVRPRYTRVQRVVRDGGSGQVS